MIILEAGPAVTNISQGGAGANDLHREVELAKQHSANAAQRLPLKTEMQASNLLATMTS